MKLQAFLPLHSERGVTAEEGFKRGPKEELVAAQRLPGHFLILKQETVERDGASCRGGWWCEAAWTVSTAALFPSGSADRGTVHTYFRNCTPSGSHSEAKPDCSVFKWHLKGSKRLSLGRETFLVILLILLTFPVNIKSLFQSAVTDFWSKLQFFSEFNSKNNI